MTTDKTRAAWMADLQHPDKNVRIEAALELGKLADARALPALVERIGETSDAMRSTLHDAVAAFGASAVPALLSALADTGTALATKVEVVEILGSIGGGEVIAPLAKALTDDAWEVRFAAVNALRRQSDAATVSTLLPATHDVHPRVRMIATRAVQDLT
jgi:HEAT repeats/PBS lyase HEAT-like repeat